MTSSGLPAAISHSPGGGLLLPANWKLLDRSNVRENVTGPAVSGFSGENEHLRLVGRLRRTVVGRSNVIPTAWPQVLVQHSSDGTDWTELCAFLLLTGAARKTQTVEAPWRFAGGGVAHLAASPLARPDWKDQLRAIVSFDDEPDAANVAWDVRVTARSLESFLPTRS